jgi:hypothetical protein
MITIVGLGRGISVTAPPSLPGTPEHGSLVVA